MKETDDDTAGLLAAAAAGNADTLASVFAIRDVEAGGDGLDLRTSGLVRIAALVALDGPPASYASQVAMALEGGATPGDVLEVLRSIAGLVGSSKVVAAAPEVMLALGFTLPEDLG